MKTYICEFDTEKLKQLKYKTVQLTFELAQAAFGSYCARNKIKPLKGWKWEIRDKKTI